MRIQTELKNRKKNPIQRVMSTTVGRWIFKPLAEAIPSPVGYGAGDVITGVSAILGKDILTGDKLDHVDRALYGIATAIPYVPSIVLVEPARLVRRHVENAVHARKEGNVKEFVDSVTGLKQGVTDIKSTVKENVQNRNNPPPKA